MTNLHNGKSRLSLGRMAAAVCGACLLLAGPASAIGLKQAYEAALQNDPTYRGAYYDNEAGKENVNLGRSQLMPNLSAAYSTSKNRSDLTVENNAGEGSLSHPVYTSKSATLTLRQPIINLDALARYRQSKAQTNYAAAVFAGQGVDLAQRVISAYLDALFASEQLALAEAQRNTLLEQRKVNDHLFDKGEGTRTDSIETQARLDLAEAQVLESTDSMIAARNALAIIVGLDVNGLDTLAPNFHVLPMPPGGLDGWKSRALSHNADIQAQLETIEGARQEVSRNRAGHAPRLDFVANYDKSDSETINTYNQNSVVRSIGVQLNVPLYSGGYVNASSRQAVAALEKAKADLQVKTDKVTLEVRKEYDLVMSASTRLAASDKAVASSELLIKATEQSIKGGVRINLDLLNAQQQLYTAKRDQAQARYNYLSALIHLRSAAGTLGGDDVNEIAAYFR